MYVNEHHEPLVKRISKKLDIGFVRLPEGLWCTEYMVTKTIDGECFCVGFADIFDSDSYLSFDRKKAKRLDRLIKTFYKPHRPYQSIDYCIFYGEFFYKYTPGDEKLYKDEIPMRDLKAW